MNAPLDSADDKAEVARESVVVYSAADELLEDLRGKRGVDSRSIAEGYVMALHDAGTDHLCGETLLRYLCGADGESMRLTGAGYVMAVRDGMNPASEAASMAGARSTDADTDTDTQALAAVVKRWLEKNSSTLNQSAHLLVRSALKGTPGTTLRRRSLRWLASELSAWTGAQSAFAKGMAIATLCLASVLVWQNAVDSRALKSRALEQNVLLSQRTAQLVSLLLEERRFEKDSFINMSNRDQIASYEKKWNDSRIALAETIASTSKLDLSASDLQAIKEIETDFQAYVTGYLRVMSRIQNGQIRTSQEANEQLGIYKDAVHRIEANGAALNARAVQRIDKPT